MNDQSEARPSGALLELPASTSPAALLRIAVERGDDIAKLEKLMDLQERWEANQARKAFVFAMTEFKSEPLEILKRKLVSFPTRDGGDTSYRHAELSDVTDVVCPAMAKHGLSHRWHVDQEGPQITVSCILTHVGGHSESVVMYGVPDASGKKNAIQQVASTVTYLQRYTLLSICGIATKGMDDDGRGPVQSEDELKAEAIIADFRDKIAMASSLDELHKIKPEIQALADKRDLVAIYNAKQRELKAGEAQAA